MADYFYNPINQDIAMIQGDTMSFGFQVQGLEGEPPTSIDFTCKETPESSEALFEVSLEDHIELRDYDSEHDIYTYGVRIPPAYTEDIEVGRYFYDLQLKTTDDVITLMTGRLAIDYQITTV